MRERKKIGKRAAVIAVPVVLILYDWIFGMILPVPDAFICAYLTHNRAELDSIADDIGEIGDLTGRAGIDRTELGRIKVKDPEMYRKLVRISYMGKIYDVSVYNDDEFGRVVDFDIASLQSKHLVRMEREPHDRREDMEDGSTVWAEEYRHIADGWYILDMR
ncbi:MAG: hypothetical protein IKR73_01745 [Oscillospiraceae bacterium]|nr:hypothetical protein [Oscillospiraceae bacterium]